MNESILIGLAYALVAGVFAGSFSFPMKFAVDWKWQRNWMIFSVWALLIMPLLVAFIFIPDLWQVYGNTGEGILLKVFLYGMIWGVGVICFGLKSPCGMTM